MEEKVMGFSAIYPKKFAKYLPMPGFPTKVGTALQISITSTKDNVVKLFVELAPQVKNKPPTGSSESPFSWEKKIFISLKDEEVAKLLTVFKGRVKSTQIIHKFPIDGPAETQKTSTLTVAESEYNGNINWKLGLGQKIGNGEQNFLQIYLQEEDIEILVVLLTECLKRMYNL
jgi:hypothetical protein